MRGTFWNEKGPEGSGLEMDTMGKAKDNSPSLGRVDLSMSRSDPTASPWVGVPISLLPEEIGENMREDQRVEDQRVKSCLLIIFRHACGLHSFQKFTCK